MPRTKPSCACSVRTQSRFVRFHNFTCGFGRKKKDPVCIVICNTEPRTHVCTLVQSYLSIAGAGEQSGEAGGVFGHAVHPISVTIQGSQERLGQHPLELGGIESTGVLSAHLERMEVRIIVPRN